MILEYQADGAENKNTGASEQFLEGTSIRHALATLDQKFATQTSAKTLADWKADRDLKKIIPLFEIEELTDADTADKTFEGREKTYTTAYGKKVRKFNCYVGVASHSALKSYNGKKMRIYEFTDKQEILGTTPDNVIVKGQLVTVKIDKRKSPMPDKPGYTPVEITYADYTEFEDKAVILRPTWSHIELNGIFDVNITQDSASTTSVKFKVSDLNGNKVTSLANADLVFLKPDGTAQAHSFVAADADGIYEFTGTGFVTASTIKTNGVVAQTEASYESVAPLTITI